MDTFLCALKSANWMKPDEKTWTGLQAEKEKKMNTKKKSDPTGVELCE